MNATPPATWGNRVEPGGASSRPVPGWLHVAVLLLAALSLCWPAWVNNGPFLLSDTTAYLRSADAAVSTVSSVRTVWSDRIEGYKEAESAPSASAAQVAPPGAQANPAPNGATPMHPPLLGRSVYFGFVLYLPAVLFGEAAALLPAALAIAYTLWLALAPLSLAPRRKLAAFLAVSLALAMTTPLAYVTSTLMPDYLSGLLIVAFILVALFWGRYSRFDRAFLVLVVVFACLSHTSNLLLTAGMLVVALALRFLKWPVNRSIFAAGLAALAIGAGGDALFTKAVEAFSGLEPVRPPFLTARLVSDGPGYEFMRDECGRSDFTICRYSRILPTDSDVILWSNDPTTGVFSVADWDTQAKLGKEDTRFALAVLEHDPVGLFGSSVASFAKQLVLIDFDYVNRTFGLDKAANLPPSVAEQVRQSRSAQGNMWTLPATLLSRLTAGLSVLAILVLAVTQRGVWHRRWAAAVLLVLAGIVINAAISGILSKPDPRYTLKVLWALPLIVGLAWYGLRRERALEDTGLPAEA